VTCSLRRSALNSLRPGITKGCTPPGPAPAPRAGPGRGRGHLGALVHVSVRGRTGDAVVTAELPGPGPVAEPPQDHGRPLAAGQRSAPGRRHRLRRSRINSRVTKRAVPRARRAWHDR
jgi:hypothetical protein